MDVENSKPLKYYKFEEREKKYFLMKDNQKLVQ